MKKNISIISLILSLLFIMNNKCFAAITQTYEEDLPKTVVGDSGQQIETTVNAMLELFKWLLTIGFITITIISVVAIIIVLVKYIRNSKNNDDTK